MAKRTRGADIGLEEEAEECSVEKGEEKKEVLTLNLV